ncbi:MAG: 50S ribosomal protein L15 [Bdellovibrionaceae bacterium]|nr:50S ribosomal protein L15 [Pseudobdellovibrionaceae bacterium]|tara:strand:+ start:509 stop:1006 length:498 start_codon:yes stop_codon:yes gene_type:complete
MLKLNNIRKHPGATHQKKRLGRGVGTGHGDTAGKGHKGQKARKSGQVRIGFEGGQTPLYRRLPKKGFKNPFRRTKVELNLVDLERLASRGMKEVSLEALVAANLVKGRPERLVVLGNGELTQGVSVQAHHFSKSAEEKIQKAGGSILVQMYPGASEAGQKKTKTL